MAANQPAQKYYDALIASYDILTDVLAKASDRGITVTRQFATDVAKGQREALELGRKLAAEPAEAGKYYTTILEATTAAEWRALAFAQLAFQQAIGASGEARATVEKLVEANRETALAAVEMARNWAALSPLADIMRKTMGATNPQSTTAETAPNAEKPDS